MRMLPRIADPIIDERERAAFEQSWQVLAPNLEQARAVRSQAAANPELLSQPGNQALLKWLEAFERQLVALERFHEAAANAALDLPVDDVRVARSTADDLFNTLQETRNLLAGGAAAAAPASEAAR
jgi:hypothetical protein